MWRDRKNGVSTDGACGDCLSFVPIKIKINFLKMKKVGNHSVRKISERTIVEVLKHFKMIQEK